MPTFVRLILRRLLLAAKPAVIAELKRVAARTDTKLDDDAVAMVEEICDAIIRVVLGGVAD